MKKAWPYQRGRAALRADGMAGEGVVTHVFLSRDEENELGVNWMRYGLIVTNNTAYCAAVAVEPHHQHNALHLSRLNAKEDPSC